MIEIEKHTSVIVLKFAHMQICFIFHACKPNNDNNNAIIMEKKVKAYKDVDNFLYVLQENNLKKFQGQIISQSLKV